MKERYYTRGVIKTAEGLLQNPPKIILVFDFAGAKEFESVTRMRSAIAASIYHSNLYANQEKPIVCCFAGSHGKGLEPGSSITLANFYWNMGLNQRILTSEKRRLQLTLTSCSFIL